MNGPITITLDQLRRAHPGGIGVYLRGLVAGLGELAALGEAPAVTGLAPRGPEPDPLTSLPIDLRVTRLDVRVMTRLWRVVALGVPRESAVVHAGTMAGPFSGGCRDAVHSVSVHDVLWRDHPELTTAAGARFHEQRYRQIIGLEQVRIVASSTRTKDRLIADGVDPHRVHLVRLGVDSPSSVSPLDRDTVLAQLGLTDAVGPSGHYTLVVGTVQPRKNLERLIVAHEKARAKVSELGPLVVAGQRGWGDVDLHGSLFVDSPNDETLRSLIAHCRVNAYVPIEEGWGLPPVEALAAGRPVLAATGVPSVEDNSHVVHADPLEVDALVQGLVDAAALDDGELERDARRASVKHLTWATCARDHLAAWS